MGQHYSKSDIPVPVVRIVPVAVRTTQVSCFIVEGTAAKDGCLFVWPHDYKLFILLYN